MKPRKRHFARYHERNENILTEATCKQGGDSKAPTFISECERTSRPQRLKALRQNLGENHSQQKQKSLPSSIVNFDFFSYQNNMKASFLFFKFLPRKCSQLRKLAKMTWMCTVLFFNYSTSSVFKIN